MRTIFKIRYWCDAYYSHHFWDNYYCKSLASTKRKLKALLKEDLESWELKKNECDEILKDFEKWELERYTLVNRWALQADAWEVFIIISEIELI